MNSAAKQLNPFVLPFFQLHKSSKVGFVDMLSVQSHRTVDLKGPTLGLIHCCHHLEILSFAHRDMHFHLELSPINSVASPEVYDNFY